jgi:hypothetical protein
LATNPLAQTGIFLDRHRDRRRLGTCRRQQPGTQLGEAGAAMQKCALPGDLALGIRLDASRLPSRCRRTIWHHSSYRTSLSPPGHRDAHRSLYWRSRRNSPPDERRGQPIRARVPQVLEAQEAMVWLPTSRPGPASLRCRPARERDEGYRTKDSGGIDRRPSRRASRRHHELAGFFAHLRTAARLAGKSMERRQAARTLLSPYRLRSADPNSRFPAGAWCIPVSQRRPSKYTRPCSRGWYLRSPRTTMRVSRPPSAPPDLLRSAPLVA